MARRKKATLLAHGKERRLGSTRSPWRVRLYAPPPGGPAIRSSSRRRPATAAPGNGSSGGLAGQRVHRGQQAARKGAAHDSGARVTPERSHPSGDRRRTGREMASRAQPSGDGTRLQDDLLRSGARGPARGVGGDAQTRLAARVALRRARGPFDESAPSDDFEQARMRSSKVSHTKGKLSSTHSSTRVAEGVGPTRRECRCCHRSGSLGAPAKPGGPRFRAPGSPRAPLPMLFGWLPLAGAAP